MTFDSETVIGIDIWQLRVPLAKSYHLSHLIGTMTHSEGFVVRLTLANGVTGWGEGNPQLPFDGFSQETGYQALIDQSRLMIGQSLTDLPDQEPDATRKGAPSAALNIASFDALGKSRGVPVWNLLGTQVRDSIEVLWPTSNGTAADDLEIIGTRLPQGFKTYMLKMGSQPIDDEVVRTHELLGSLPDGVRVMIDANQGWTREEAQQYLERTAGLPIILLEQPLQQEDLKGLGQLRGKGLVPISVDESVSTLQQAQAVLDQDAADIFSIKVSKNGGLTNGKRLAALVNRAGKKVLMNSMIELGLCQAASLQLAATLENLVPCGHAYMSTLRMSDDVTNFSELVHDGQARVPNLPGLGVEVSLDKLKQYAYDHIQIG